MALITITDFEFTHIVGIDLGHLIKPKHESTFHTYRGSTDWLSEIKERFVEKNHLRNFGLVLPHFDQPQYNKAEETGRNTFSSYYAFNLMPLSFDLIPLLSDQPNYHFSQGAFKSKVQSFRLSPKGSITIRINSLIDQELEVEKLIEQYYSYQKDLRTRLPQFANEFVKCWNEHIPQIVLNEFKLDDMDRFAHTYEIFDFDYKIKSDPSVLIKDILENDDYIEALKDIAGLSRMSKYAYTKYHAGKLKDFKSQNFGNREDELWLINAERMLRYHPEKTKDNVKFLFDDVKLGLEILLQQEVSFEFLTAWTNRKRSELRLKFARTHQNDKEFEKEVEKLLIDIVNISDILSDPFIIQRNVKHSFYNTVLTKAIEAMALQQKTQQAREAFNDFFALVSVYTSQKLSNISLKFDSANLKFNKTIRRLTVLMIILALLTLIFGGLSTYFAYKQLDAVANPAVQKEIPND